MYSLFSDLRVSNNDIVPKCKDFIEDKKVRATFLITFEPTLILFSSRDPRKLK